MLLAEMGEPVACTFRRRAATHQHPEGRRHALYAIFLAHRKREITDGLVDLLVDIVHKIRSQAKHTTIRRLSQEIERIQGKETLLVRIAEAATGNPDGMVREVVFPAVGEDVLSAVIRKHKASGSFERRVHTVLRASYAGHYRRMLSPVLTALVFQSNNAVHRPVLDAIDWIKRLTRTAAVWSTPRMGLQLTV
jgi:hypothetical protein